MKTYTAEEIEKKVREIWTRSDNDYWTEPDSIEVTVQPREVRITISAMFDSPPMNLPLLLKLAKFMGTMNINDDRFVYGGCETCDYGSKHGFTLTVRP